jgi:hypothetical protein
MLINSITDRLEEITDRLEEIIFHHVVYHHSFSHNLLSVGRLWQDYRIAVQFDNFKYLQCYSSGGRYRFTYDNGYNYIVPYQHLLRTMVSIPSIGDLGVVAIATFAGWFLAVARNLSNFNGTFEHDPASCDACMAGDGKKKPFPRRASQQFMYFGQRLSSNLHHLHVSTLHTDNGGEFLKADLDAFCEESATRRSFSVPCCPPQNASAERMWGRVTHDCPHSIMTRTASMDAVHCRFGHCGHRRIRHMLSCDACMAGFGQHLSSYLCKPFPCKPFPVSVASKNALVIVEAATNFAFWHLLSDKSATQVCM